MGGKNRRVNERVRHKVRVMVKDLTKKNIDLRGSFKVVISRTQLISQSKEKLM